MIILFILYVVLGYKSIDYCKYYLLNIRFEFTNFVKKVAEGVILGWITIPIMILHSIYRMIVGK